MISRSLEATVRKGLELAQRDLMQRRRESMSSKASEALRTAVRKIDTGSGLKRVHP